MSERKIPPATFWRVARNTLGRMACRYADPGRDGHDHEDECLRDDESLAADRMLNLIGAAYSGDEGKTLDALTLMLDTINREG